MEFPAPVNTDNTPRRDLRLRGMPSHIVEVLTQLESSGGSSENSDATLDSPMTDVTLTARIHSLTRRLLEFKTDTERTKADNAILRKSLQETKRMNENKDDASLRDIIRMKNSLDEASAQIQNLRNDLELSNADAEALSERTIELEKGNLILERKSQNTQQQCQRLRTKLSKMLVEKTELEESRNEMEVEFASEQNRSNTLASELQKVLRQLEEYKSHQPGSAGVSVPQKCPSCAQRLSLEENLKKKIGSLEADLQSSKKDAEGSEKKLQALAEELRVRVLKEKARAQKLIRENSELAAERVNASQRLKAFEGVLDKACSETFHGEAHDDYQLNNAILQADEPMTSEEVFLRRVRFSGEIDATVHGSLRQAVELPDDCKMT